MSEERKKVSAEQLQILIDELENDRTLVSGRDGRAKADHQAKWEQLAKKLNTFQNGAIKSVTKWQQALRDWKNNTKKKAAKLEANKNSPVDSNQELTSLEVRLLTLYNNDLPTASTVGIDISSIVEFDPLSSDNSCDEKLFPATYTTYTCDSKNEDPTDTMGPTDNNRIQVKRRRVEVMSQELINQQNRLLERLSALEASRQESENRQNTLLEALASALDRHSAATASLARAADAHAHVARQLLGALRENGRDAGDAT